MIECDRADGLRGDRRSPAATAARSPAGRAGARRDLVTATGMSQPNTSRHLGVLRRAGLVTSHTSGRRRVYELRVEGFTEVARWLTPYVVSRQRRLQAPR